MPGHTVYAVALFGVVDGRRVGITGDEIQLDGEGLLRGGGPVYRNGFRTGAFTAGFATVAAHAPEIVLTGHDGPIELNAQRIEDLHAWARELDDAHAALAAFPDAVDLALDANLVSVDPYRIIAVPGSATEVALTVTNHFATEREIELSVDVPTGWQCNPPVWRQAMAGGATATTSVALTSAADAAPGVRTAVGVSVTVGDLRLGSVAEVVVSITESELSTGGQSDWQSVQ